MVCVTFDELQRFCLLKLNGIPQTFPNGAIVIYCSDQRDTQRFWEEWTWLRTDEVGRYVRDCVEQAAVVLGGDGMAFGGIQSSEVELRRGCRSSTRWYSPTPAFDQQSTPEGLPRGVTTAKTAVEYPRNIRRSQFCMDRNE